MPESKFHHFSPKGLCYTVTGAEAAVSSLEEGGYIWLNYYCPAKEDLNKLVELLGIHPLSVEDCLDSSQVPKIEHFPNSTFIIFNSYSYIEKLLSIDEVDFFIGKNWLITVSGVNSDGRAPLNNMGAIIDKDLTVLKAGPAFLLHVILDYVVDQKFHAVEALEYEMEESEDEVLNNPSTFKPAKLVSLRKDLVNLRKSLFHEREILIKICRKDCPFIPDKAIVHFRDIYDHLAKFFELTESYREIVTSLMELYTSLLNNLMTKASNETNISVRRLTLITTVFMPLTLLASIGGMSEWSMMTGPSNWKIAYPLFLLGMVVIGIFNYILIKRLDRKNKLES
jgi:magnesium transporter